MSKNDGAQPPSDEDITEDTAPVQVAKLELVSTKHHYDKIAIQSFIDLVFHTQPTGSEVALFAPRSGNLPGYPVDSLNAFDTLLSGTKPRALYYSTASIQRQADGLLRNKLANFAGLHVLVLDDIGTKVDAADLPAGMATPTYIVESSAGNYQYGYVLDKPIMDQDEAQALVGLLKNHEPRITDKGGVMLGKAVRLPDGVNGKKGEKGRFHVKLTKSDGPFYPSAVIRRELEAGQVLPPKKAARAMSYKPLFDMPDFGRPADEALMYLYAHEMVLADDPNQNEWTTIECPWGHDHSDSVTAAGYSPLGYGEGKNAHSRGFKCFHDHCSSRDTDEFLTWIVRNDNSIKALAREVPPEAQIPLDKYGISTEKAGGAFSLAARTASEIQLGGMKQKFYTDVWVCDGTDTKKRLNAADYWAINPLTLRADGLGYEVSEDKILEDGGRRVINKYGPPPWTDGDYDQAAVDKFIAYINYLLPEPEEAAYFLDWLAAKIQDPRFRGSAILMVTDGTQGVGRTTLSKYVEDLVGAWNSSSIQFDQMVNDSFNEWITSLVVVVNEVKDSDMKSYRKQEVLKHYVDTSPVKVPVNVKNGFKGSAETCASFLMFSNHTDALRLAREDRRFTVLRNTDEADADMTADMATWRLNKEEYNAEDLYRYLRQRVITNDLYKTLKTAASEEMRKETKGVTEKIVDAISRACEEEDLIAIPAARINPLIGQVFRALGMEEPSDPNVVYMRVKKNYFYPALSTATVRAGGETIKPRMVKEVAKSVPGVAGIKSYAKVKHSDLRGDLSDRLNVDISRFDEKAILSIVGEMLSD